MRLLATVLVLGIMALAQEPPAPPLAPRADGRIPIFIGDSEQFYSSSFGIASKSGASHVSQSGTMKFTVLLMKEISKHCSNAVVVNSPDLANYFVRFEVNASFLFFHPGMAVFSRSGDMVFVDTSIDFRKEAKHLCATPPFTSALKKSKKK